MKNILLPILFCMLSVATHAGPVNINTADAETLAAELKGIGLSRAQAIIDYRQSVGPYKSPEDLLETSGSAAPTKAAGERFLAALDSRSFGVGYFCECVVCNGSERYASILHSQACGPAILFPFSRRFLCPGLFDTPFFLLRVREPASSPRPRRVQKRCCQWSINR